MSRFKPASAEELARRGLNPDGTPIKKTAPKPEAKKPAPKKAASKKKG
jgi:hypothetical protein